MKSLLRYRCASLALVILLNAGSMGIVRAQSVKLDLTGSTESMEVVVPTVFVPIAERIATVDPATRDRELLTNPLDNVSDPNASDWIWATVDENESSFLLTLADEPNPNILQPYAAIYRIEKSTGNVLASYVSAPAVDGETPPELSPIINIAVEPSGSILVVNQPHFYSDDDFDPQLLRFDSNLQTYALILGGDLPDKIPANFSAEVSVPWMEVDSEGDIYLVSEGRTNSTLRSLYRIDAETLSSELLFSDFDDYDDYALLPDGDILAIKSFNQVLNRFDVEQTTITTILTKLNISGGAAFIDVNNQGFTMIGVITNISLFGDDALALIDIAEFTDDIYSGSSNPGFLGGGPVFNFRYGAFEVGQFFIEDDHYSSVNRARHWAMY